MSVDEQEYNNSVTTLASAIKETFPDADVRIGTPVRDLVLNPGGVAHATAISAADDISTSSDLRGGTVNDEELVDGLLRNLGVDRADTTNAVGDARIILDTAVDFAIPAGYTLTFGDVNYVVPSEITVGTDTSIVADLYLTPYTDTALSPNTLYSVVVGVTATNGGAAGNIQIGSALTVVHALTPYTQWQVAAADFTGGSEGETVEESLARAERQLGQQSMSSAPAIDGLLQTINPQVTSTGVVRSIDLEIQRNKRNIFAMAVGSHVDVYLRDFAQATVSNVTAEATRVSDGVYTIADIEAPGWMTLAYVSSAEPFGTSASTAATYNRFAIDTGGHAMSGQVPLDVYGTSYQRMSITLSGVEPVPVDGVLIYPETLLLYIGAYVSPSTPLLQDTVDSSQYQSNTTDHLLHAPYLAVTSVKLRGRNSNSTSTIETLTAAVLDVINSVPIGGTLTITDITTTLSDLGVTVTSDVALSASIEDATGNLHTLQGSELVPSSLGKELDGISNKTVSFTSLTTLIELDISDTVR